MLNPQPQILIKPSVKLLKSLTPQVQTPQSSSTLRDDRMQRCSNSQNPLARVIAQSDLAAAVQTCPQNHREVGLKNSWKPGVVPL